MFKSQLHEYAQKAGLPAPIYNVTMEGPSHEPQFKASVTIQGKTYESPAFFKTLRKAEHVAAELALAALATKSNSCTSFPGREHESGLCKNLLQVYAQKCKLPLPVYSLVVLNETHPPSFSATVEIAGVHYKGGACKSKKEAEIKAAKTALISIFLDSGGSSLQASENQLPSVRHHGIPSASIRSYSTTSESGNKNKKMLKGPQAGNKHKRELKLNGHFEKKKYAKKDGSPASVYDITMEELSYESQFETPRTAQRTTFESLAFFGKLKKAEHVAAELALATLTTKSDISMGFPGPLHEFGLYKNLLQDYAQQCKLPLPVYSVVVSGEAHSPSFSAMVEVAGVYYYGGACKSKKEAEIKAARTALIAFFLGAYPLQDSENQLPFVSQHGTLSTSKRSSSRSKSVDGECPLYMLIPLDIMDALLYVQSLLISCHLLDLIGYCWEPIIRVDVGYISIMPFMDISSATSYRCFILILEYLFLAPSTEAMLGLQVTLAWKRRRKRSFIDIISFEGRLYSSVTSSPLC